MIFQPFPREEFEITVVCDDRDWDVFNSFDGSPRSSSWQPIKVRRTRADERHEQRSADFPWMGSDALVMRKRAADALRDILESHGEILPLATDDEVELFVFNAIAIDALDESKSKIWRFPGSNRIGRIEKPVLREAAVRGFDIFRLPHRAAPTYVSDRFVLAAKKSGLTGLEFKEVALSS